MNLPGEAPALPPEPAQPRPSPARRPPRLTPSGARLAAALAGFDVGRRFTWFMVLRLVVTTLLFAAAVAADAAGGGIPRGTNRPLLFALIAMTYGFSLLWSLLLRRGGSPRRLAALQIICDAALVTLLVHADGGADSGFVALYLMLVVGANMMLRKDTATATTVGMAVAYVVVALGDRAGLLPQWPGESASGPLGTIVFTLGKNLVLFAAAHALSRRLAGDVELAGQRIAAQTARFDQLAALHGDIVRSMTSGLLTVDDDGRVTSLNPAGEEILGIGAQELSGRRLDEELPELARTVAQVHDHDGKHKRMEAELTRPDGERRVVGMNVAAVVSASGQRVARMVNFQDLTELRRMQERIERAERLAAIGRLAAGIAHEIRNPLAAISGSIELLAPTVEKDPDSRDLTAILTREVERLNRLISDLLDFARPHPPMVAPVEVGTALREILRVVENDRRLNPGPNRFELQFAPVWVDADPGQLRQVVLNLLLNAADATPGGEAIELRAFPEAEQAVIEVRDRGPGIPVGVRARIFEPFFTTKPGGTGLGLATVHRIVEEHHGTIEVEQPASGGTLFRIRLPRRPAGEG